MMRDPKWVQFLLEAKLDPKKFYRFDCYHDSWCRIYKTHRASDCNCNPDVKITECLPEEAAKPLADEIVPASLAFRRVD